MSQYISSFFIDPVVRQARRLSRPSFTSLDSQQHESTQPSTGALDGARQFLASRTPSFSFPALLGTGQAHSSTSLPASSAKALPRYHARGSLRLIEIANLEPAIPARQYALRQAQEPFAYSSGASPESDVAGIAILGANIPTDPQVNGEGFVSQTTETGLQGPSIEDRSRYGEGGLPEDDGMGPMRRQILAIQRADSPSEVKARLIYALMTESHHASKPASPLRACSPASLQSMERSYTPGSPRSDDSRQPTLSPPTTSSSSAEDGGNPFNLMPEDLIPTFWKRLQEDREEGFGLIKTTNPTEEEENLGCLHYKRNIKLQCFACNRWYTCRFCHDAVEDHYLNRRETKRMLCMLCGCAQPASAECVLCGHSAAWYYCDVCKLWDDHPRKEIYHCEDCGICRIGAGIGKSHLHCKTCNVCMEMSHFDRHRCVERSTDCDCPICGEYLFTSPEGVVFMPCGHSIHRTCYSELMKATYRCPVCSRSIPNMERQFLDLRREIELQPMPEEFQDTKAWIYCNDCTGKSNVKYHWLGLECEYCGSFNTAQLSLSSDPANSPPPTVPADEPDGAQLPSHPGLQRRHSASLIRPRAVASFPSLNLFSRSLAFPSLEEPGRTGSAYRRQVSGAALSSHEGSLDGDEESDCSCSVDEDDGSDDVGFWGALSPRIFSTSPSERITEEMALDSEDDDDEEDDEDEDDVDDEYEDEDDQSNDEDQAVNRTNVLDQLEIIGHR